MYTGSWLQYKLNIALKELDISEPQFNVLRILRGQQGAAISQQDIQSRMLQKMSNVSRIMDKLLDKQLAERKECKSNRRQVEIFITPKGLNLLHDADVVVEHQFQEIFAHTTKEDANRVNILLDHIR